MSIVLYLIVFANLALISVFVGYHYFFIVWSWLVRKGSRSDSATNDKLNKFAIIVPAHNEESIIAELLRSVKTLDYPKAQYDVMIIADNCTDGTENVVKENGFQCYVRKSSKKGKPYALNWIFKQIQTDIYDAFTIIDADTMLDKNYLNMLNQKLNGGAEAIQAYFGIMNPDDSWLTKLMLIPGFLKFKIRYYCKDIVGLSCPLMGNGMCFSKKIIEAYGWNAFSITENWEYYVELLIHGYTVAYEEDAVILSHAVTKLAHGEVQRKRWFKGRLNVLLKYYRKLLAKFYKDKDLRILDTLIELALPSYSMLFAWSFLLLLVALLLLLLGFENNYLVIWSIVLIVMQLANFVYGLIISKAPLKTWLFTILIPAFLIWKVFVTIKGIIGIKDTDWQKTERKL